MERAKEQRSLEKRLRLPRERDAVVRRRLSVAGWLLLAGLASGCSTFINGVAGAQQKTSAQQKTLTTASEVFHLPSAEAAEERPVHLIATVNYFEAGRFILFVSDATGGVYVSPREGFPNLRRGDLIEITGVTRSSYNSAVAHADIRVLGKGPLPNAKAATFRQLVSGELDCQYVWVEGIVRSASPKKDASGRMAQLEILVPGGVMRTYVEDASGLSLSSLIDAEVQVAGVAGGLFNGREQLMSGVLYVSDRSQLKVLRAQVLRPVSLALTPIDKVIPTRFVEDRSERVRVQGAVTFYEPANAVVIQHNGESLLALTHDFQPIVLGSVVDVVGFAAGSGYGPTLEEAEILPTGRFEAIKPQPASYADAMAGRSSDGLITLSGIVLSELHDSLSDSMVLTVDGHPVNVLLWTGDRPRLPNFLPGTKVTVTGICRILRTDSWNNATAFRLDLRETDDVEVLALPSWWTVTHLLMLLIGLLLASLTISGWALMLRRRVAAQREHIERSMQMEQQRSRLLELISSEMPLDELLLDICRSTEALVVGIECSYELLAERGTISATLRGESKAQTKVLYEVVLKGTEGQRVGLFQASGKRSNMLSREEIEMLSVGASLADLAVKQRRLYQQLNYYSTHDQLTGLANRRLSDTHLNEAIERARAKGLRLGVVYIDVNDFKQVNDRFGHEAGDLYLQEIARRLSEMVRSADLLARIGGDEFLVTATGLKSAEDAFHYKQRLLACFHESFPLDGVNLRGSASAGLAVYPEHGRTAAELQRYADMEMYSAKQKCRITLERSAS